MSKNMKTIFAGALFLSLVLVVNGAIPGYMAPTSGQLFWLIGFSESFVNTGSLYAQNFGLPEPAAPAFGLAASLPAAVLLKVGSTPAAAYGSVFALWLTVAFAGAYHFAQSHGVSHRSALTGALIWCTFPIAWSHNGYATLALGIVLLPTYFFSAKNIVVEKISILTIIAFVITAIISVFMDGYTFVMYAAGTCIFFGAVLLNQIRTPHVDLLYRFFIIAAGFGCAYGLYAIYQGVLEFDTAPTDFFRGWGASIEFFMVPTSRVLALPDLLGLSDVRYAKNYFGDSSTYVTTFCAFIVVFAMLGAVKIKEHKLLLLAYGVIAIAGFYMALGPTVKFLTYRPIGASQFMDASEGWFSTGSAIITDNLPGFRNMRASYRWTALGMLGCWAIYVLMLASARLSARVKAGMSLTLLAFNIPSPAQIENNRRSYNMVVDLTKEVESWRYFFREGETVAFLPYGNDFLINYAASALDIRTYNIGGDKNLAAARRHWPDEMRAFEIGQTGPFFELNVRAFLESGKTNAVAFPYISLLWAPHKWPAPTHRKKELFAVAKALEADARYVAEYGNYFAVVRLADGLKPAGAAFVANSIKPIGLHVSPRVINDTLDPKHLWGRGWHNSEPNGTWSREGDASIRVNLSDISASEKIRLTYTVFAPGGECTDVIIRSGTNDIVNREYCGVEVYLTADLPVGEVIPSGQINFIVGELRSPADHGSADGRQLGVFLHSISVVDG